MRRNWLLHAVMAGFTLVVALMSSGLADLSSNAAVYAQGLAAAQAHRTPPKGPDLGRFTPTINVPHKAPTAWKPKTSTAVAPKTKRAQQGGASSGAGPATGRTPGEQPDLRTATSSTILNADGTWSRLIYAVPIHFQDANGVWQNIDTRITADSSDPGYAFTNAANSWRIHFAQQSGGTQFVHAKFAQTEYFETIANAASVRAAPHGSQITYPNIFPNVDAVYTIMHAHIEETLLLHSANVPANFTFTYHVPGATARQDQSGNIVFTDAKGVVVLVIDAPVMFEADSQGSMLPAAAGSDHVAMTLAGSGPDYAVTLTPDAQWLADPSRKFPVAIDPTYSSSDPHTNTSSGNIYADTFNESGNPTWAFYTTNSERVGDCSALPSGALGYGTGVNRSYIKFPVDPAPAGNLRVTSATLALYQTSAYAGATQINAEEIVSAWNATTLDWNNRPSGNPMKGYATTNTSYNTTLNIDVSAMAYDWWKAGVANNGISLRFNNENVACDFFASDDYGSNLPKLTINYVIDATAPAAGVSVTASNPYVANGVTYTNSTSAQLSSTFSDPGATTAFTSNWATVNGVGTNGSFIAPNYTLNGGILTADTSTCGATSCAVDTYFTSTVSNMSADPTFTTMFQSDLGGAFYFGAVGSGHPSTRFDIIAPAGGSAFTEAAVSTYADAYTVYTINIPFSPNTWYYGQVTFPSPRVGQIYIWPVGQAKPATPSYVFSGLYMANPGLNFYEYGTNGAGTHHYDIGATVITSGSTSGTIGYGPWGLQYSNDQTTWACQSPSGTWCIANDKVAQPWTLSAGDGAKTVYARSIDNAGLLSSAAASASVALDQTAPTGSITAPGAGREVRGGVTVQTQATDPVVNGYASGLASATLYLDGAQIGQALDTDSPSFTWDTTGVAPGPHMLSVVVADHVGNSYTSAGVMVDVANTGQSQYNTYAMRDLPDGTTAGANVASGDALVIHQDLDIPSYGPDLALTRTYNSLGPINNLFGWGWTSDLDEGVIANADGSVTYRDPDGGLHIFLPNGSGGYLSSPGLNLTLTKNADNTYTLTARDQSQTVFTSTGYLWKLIDRNGNTLQLYYNGATLTHVNDASTRALQITISGGHITQIVDPLSHTYTYTYDGSGNLTGYTNPSGVNTLYGYDSAHHLNQITANCTTCVAGDPAGATDWETNVTTTLTYDSLGRLVKIVDPLGYDADFSYGVGQPGTLQTQVAQLQTTTTGATYPTYPTTPTASYETTTYTLANDGSGAVTAIQDPAGDPTLDPAGGTTSYQYDSNERVTQVTDQGGKVTQYTYDANGNELTQRVDPNGLDLKTTWTYDSGNNVLTETDPRAIETKYTYDSPATGNLIQTIQNYVSPGTPQDSQSNVTTSSTYDSHGQMLTETNALGIVTQYSYDPYGDLIQTVKNATSTPSVTTSATYNILGQQLTSTDALNIVTQYTPDVMGNVIQTVQNYQSGGPSGQGYPDINVTTSASFDALDRPWTQTSAPTTASPNGIVTLTVYDADGRVKAEVRNCTDTTNLNCYVNNASLASATANVMTKSAFDAAGNATQATDAKGNTTVTTYDGDNRAIEVVLQDASNNNAAISEKTTTYDAVGHVTATQVIDGANNPVTSYTYDAAGRQKTETDPPADPTDPTTTDPGYVSNVTTTTYDQDGNATDQVVTNVNVSGDVSDTHMTYDALGRTLTKVEDANTSSPQTTSYTYDANGQQVSVTQPANNGTTQTTTTYDALGRVASSTQNYGSTDPNNPPQTTTFTYDGDGHTLSTTNSAGTTTDSYDALGRTLTEAKADSNNVTQTSVATTYDTHGNAVTTVTSYLNSPSVTVTRTFDALDHLASMNDGQRSYTYDLNGNVHSMSVLDPSGQTVVTSASYGYDGGDRLTSQIDGVASNAQFHTYSYAYNAAGDRMSAGADTATTSYTYDDSHQLLSETRGASTISYTYDGYNNRLTMTTGAGTTHYTYDPALAACGCHTELTSVTDPAGKVTSYTYDQSGNLLTATYDPSGANQITTYGYDSNNRLSSVAKPDGTTVVFAYDANGQRVSVTVTPSGGSASTVKDYYQLGHLAYQTDGAGTLLATYTYDSNGTPVYVTLGLDPTSATTRYYYVYNAHGDVVNLVDASGNVVASYSYDTWGNLTSASETIPNANGWTNPYRYDGRDGVRYDAADGLYWMSVRAYDPTIGRFISHDPLGRAPLFFSDQPYAYAGNNPVGNVDPSGQRYAGASGSQTKQAAARQARSRIRTRGGSKRARRSGTEADRCVGASRCVIFIDGVDVWLPKPRGGDYDEGSWNKWITSKQYKSKPTAAAYYVAGDGAEGMNWLHRILRGLVQNGFDGTVTVVGHSNGAAALFLYFALAELGRYSGDYPIARFVAFDAPTRGLGLNIITGIWSHWSPLATFFLANKYIRAHHIHGRYAWDFFDPVSGDVFGEGAIQEKVFFDLSWQYDPHTLLEFDPEGWLLDGL